MPKNITGQINNKGEVNIGAEDIKKATRERTGIFKVEYENPFNREPVVVITVIDDTESATGVSISESDENGFTVSLKNMHATRVNRGFNFIATM